ncbi:MAG: methyltransferase domain-containing protein [Candidatus Delongbacteria bacterium]|nr:methyltransferase domain-containing protein [Candidatus Delongbacteria bacterium]
MRNIWEDAVSYNKLSEYIQKKIVEKLLNNSNISGKILEIGCGTGNSLNYIKKDNVSEYLGIDISNNMIEFARNRYGSRNIQFYVSDFLKCSKKSIKSDYYDNVISTGVFHWFRPNEEKVMKKIHSALKQKGQFYLSLASNFKHIISDNSIKQEILVRLSNKYKVIIPNNVSFKNMRFNNSAIRKITNLFTIKVYSHFEKKIEFPSMDSFKAWNLSSGLYFKEYIPDRIREEFFGEYFKDLYKEYLKGNYIQRHSVDILHLEKN